MPISSVMIAIAMLILVIIFLAYPIYSENTNTNANLTIEHSSLLAERERILAAIKELEFDYQMGKVPEELYPDQRAGLIKRGAKVLKSIDEMSFAQNTSEPEKSSKEIIKNNPVSDAKIEEMISARKNMRKHSSSKYCHNCGNLIEADNIFCTQCGERVR